MNDKKNIERFFQEKFKDYEANPNINSWANISKKLNEKKTKKFIFPTWLLVGGIAASLIIGCLVYTKLTIKNENSKIIENNVVVGTVNKTQDSSSNKINSYKKIENSVAANDDNSDLNINDDNNNQKEANLNRNSNVETKTTVSINNNKVQINTIDKKTEGNKTIVSKNDGPKSIIIAEGTANDKIGNNTDKKNGTTGIAITINKTRAINANNGTASKISVLNNLKNKSGVNSEKHLTTYNKADNAVANKNNIDTKNNIVTENGNEKLSNSNKNNEDKLNNSLDLQNEFNSVKLPLDQKVIQNVVVNDSSKKPLLIENPLNKILVENEKLVKKKNLVAESNKWKIRPNVAPIYMKASNGSPIHDIFIDNEKTYENKFSYGLGADYAITKKFSIRAGINKFDLAYNTNDVAYYSDLTAVNGTSPDNSIQTINLKDEFHNIVIGDRKSRAAVVTPPNQTTEEVGYLSQKFGYIEIPLEVSYKLLDKRFGITVISGFSTLLLNNNVVSIVSSNKTIILGDVNNLNKTHYSSNFGIGFKYNFMKSFEINVEPTVKYQINSFDKNNGGFNPYFLGIYSGISYKL